MKPLALDLCCGLGGWAHGLIAEGWDVIGYDVERHEYGGDKYPAHLIIQDIRTIDGRQFRGRVSLIVASPPCTEFSYMAMPWKRGKQIEQALLGKGDFPEGYRGSKTISQLTELFDACVRIGREAECPIIIENVRGAQKWVGPARWAWGSFLLWGDVPALMPIPMKNALKFNGANWNQNGTGNLHDANGFKSQGMNWSDQSKRGQDFTRLAGEHCGLKMKHVEGYERDHPNAFGWKKPSTSSKSNARKAASAMIAKIPLILAKHIAKVYYPR